MSPRRVRIQEHSDHATEGFRSLFDNIFSSHRPLFSLSEKVWNPPADVYETADHVVVKMEIAGIDRKRLEITTESNYLIIRGCRDEGSNLPKDNYHLMEIRYGHFERVFAMPRRLVAEDIEAQYEQGFLVVSIAKRDPQVHKIDVQVTEE